MTEHFDEWYWKKTEIGRIHTWGSLRLLVAKGMPVGGVVNGASVTPRMMMEVRIDHADNSDHCSKCNDRYPFLSMLSLDSQMLERSHP